MNAFTKNFTAIAATLSLGLASPALAIQPTGKSIIAQPDATLPAGRMIFDESSMTGLDSNSILISQMANFMSNGDMGVDMSNRPDYSNEPESTISNAELQSILDSNIMNAVGPVFMLDGDSQLCRWYRGWGLNPLDLPYGC